MNWVIDSSFTGALFLPDEKSEIASDFFENKDENNIYVPLLWWYELANILTVSVKRNRLHYSEISEILSLFKSLDFKTDFYFGGYHTREVFEISQLYDLSGYDSVYLELCIRKNCSLATFDNVLFKSAKKAGVNTLKT